jgi:hypothetical protein
LYNRWDHVNYSAAYNKPEYIPLFVKELSHLTIPDHFERYVFHIASIENSAMFISALIEFCQEKFGEKEDSFGSTPLEVALHKHNLQSAKVLFPFMRKQDNKTKEKEMFSIHPAVIAGNVDYLELLIEV